MDAVTLLRAQHRDIRDQFGRVASALDGDKPAALAKLVDAIELHAIIEERHVYPVLRDLDLQPLAHQFGEEHLSVKRVIDDLVALDGNDPRFVPILRVLCDQVEAHMRQEETQLLRLLEAQLSPGLRSALGQSMLETVAELERDYGLGAVAASPQAG
jgi:hypothetical protein